MAASKRARPGTVAAGALGVVAAIAVAVAPAAAMSKPPAARSGRAAAPKAAARTGIEPFVVAHGAEPLAYLGPEIARVVEHACEQAGAPVTEAAAGRLDDLGGDRVRLSLTVRGQQLIEEGPLEELDAVAVRLGARLAAVLAPERVAQARPGRLASGARSAVLAAHSHDAPDARLSPVAVGDAPPAVTPAVLRPDPPSASVDPGRPPASPPAVATPAPAPPSPAPAPPPEPPRPTTTPPATSAAPPEPSPPSSPARRDDPYEDAGGRVGPGAPVSPPTVPSALPGGRRVVAHQVADIPTAYGAGWAATHALNTWLRNRLRAQVVSGGLGLVPVQVATEEAWRAGARAVVMLRLLNIEPMAGGPVRCRFEVVVVRDGRAVLRRVLDALPAEPGAGMRRGREYDPVYLAVSQSLDALSAEISSLLF